MPYTLITGASQGIGKALAIQCAQNGHQLILSALPNDGLENLGQTIAKQYNVTVHTYPLNLLDDQAIQEFYDWCVENDFQVNALINNAGLGYQGAFRETKLEENHQMMTLNMKSLVTMTYTFLPMLKKQPEARLLNVGSLASFLKLPYKAVYSGSKHFVLAFSNALVKELKHTSVKVSCLCPGPTATNAKVIARNEVHGAKAKLFVQSPEFVASKAYKAMMKGKRVEIPGNFNKAIVFFAKYMPNGWALSLADKLFSNKGVN